MAAEDRTVPKTFRAYQPDQRLLLPQDVNEMLPEGDLAYFVRETVAALDLSAILDAYAEERGQPPFHPVMMTALLLYAYARGVRSSRTIAQACERDLGFIAVAALARPDFRTVAKFRARHLKALAELFTQVLRLCRRAGLVRLGHIAIDGTKIKANASRHKAMSYRRMAEVEPELRAQVDRLLKEHAATDRADPLDTARVRARQRPHLLGQDVGQAGAGHGQVPENHLRQHHVRTEPKQALAGNKVDPLAESLPAAGHGNHIHPA